MDKPLTANIRPGEPPLGREGYEKAGGYQAARKALKEMTPLEVTQVVKDAKLRGRGGAGFPTGVKWGFVPRGEGSARPKYLVVNADEMEPGSFKDRLLLEGDPHKMVESVIVASYAIEAEVSYLFLRWAYREAARAIQKAIDEAYAAGWLGKNILGTGYNLDFHLHISAGRYICGEETALLNSLQGRRANPRAKPPFPPACGAWGKPTIVNNVETLYNVPGIIQHGAEWYRGLSLTEDGGTKIFGASGKVKTTGTWELPMGTPLREVFEKYAGGMREGYKCRAVIPGGASTAFLTAEHMDVPLDFDHTMKAGSRLGTANLAFVDDTICPVGLTLNLMKFFAQESCGWCTPCRDGLPMVRNIVQSIEEGRGKMEDLDVLQDLCRTLGPGNTFCPLAPGAVDPLASALKVFREDFEQHIREQRCPWR
jgi:NADH-quinone oxidoreductase subunit F